MHGVPADRVVVTGAQCYDQWFDRQPSRRREAFCARVGLRADRPFVLYVCSSLFRGTAERAGVRRAVDPARCARSADPRLKDIGILVRPHPARLDEWKHVDLSGYQNVAFWGAHPVDAEAKDDYFDSMYYSAAVVGLNTSAFIEAGGRRQAGAHRAAAGDFERTTRKARCTSTTCWTSNGGLLRASRSLDEHVPQLADSLAGHGGGDPKAARFVEGFVRPFGRDAGRDAALRRRRRAGRRAAGAGAGERRSCGAAGRVSPVAAAGIAAVSLTCGRSRGASARATGCARATSGEAGASCAGVKQFASPTSSSRRGSAASWRRRPPSSTLTPKAGHRRDPAKTLAGTELSQKRRTRASWSPCSAAAAGRSSLGPWLSETGFELLYWIPFLAWAKAYGNFDPDQLIVVSRGGAAPWYRHITPHYEEIFSLLHARRVPRAQRAAHRRAGRAGRSTSRSRAFDREIIARVSGEARPQRRRAAASVADVSAVRQLLAAARAGHAGRSVLAVHAAAARPAVGRPRRSCPSATSPRSSTATSALPPTPENRALRRRLSRRSGAAHRRRAAEHRRSASTTTTTSRRACAAGCTRSIT